MSKRVTAEQLAESAWQAALAPKSEPDAIPDGWLTAAQIANSKVRERYVQWGKLQVTAAEREAVADALEACDAIVEASTLLQMEAAHKRMVQSLLKSVKKT